MKSSLIWAAAGALITIYLCTFHNAVNYSDSQWDSLYMDYVTDFRKSYDSVDMFAARKEVFKANYLKMDNHNKNIDKTYEMGLNQFSDWTEEEFQSILTLRVPKTRTITYEDETVAAPKGSIDWRDLGAITPVKDQSSCGSCWAFSAVAAIESAYKIFKGANIDLSEQQLVDCDYFNSGCNGGWMDRAFDYIQGNGITTGDAYPYLGSKQACKTTGGAYTVTGHVSTGQGSVNVQNALNLRPLSVAVDANGWSAYKGGVFRNGCGTSINHGVLLVGYTTEGNWVIKNSWGQRWGDNGYITLAAGNTCAVTDYASYPLV